MLQNVSCRQVPRLAFINIYRKKNIILSIDERFTILRRLKAGEFAVTLKKRYYVTEFAISKIKKTAIYITYREIISKVQNVLKSCEENVHKRRYRGKEQRRRDRKKLSNIRLKYARQ